MTTIGAKQPGEHLRRTQLFRNFCRSVSAWPRKKKNNIGCRAINGRDNHHHHHGLIITGNWFVLAFGILAQNACRATPQQAATTADGSTCWQTLDHPASQRARSLLLSGHFTTATTNRSTGTKCVTLGDLAQQTLDLIPHPTYLPVNCLNALCKRLDWLTKRSLDSSGWKPFLGPRQLLKADSSFGVRKWKAWQRFIENGTVRASRKPSTNKQGCCLRILMI